MRPLVHRCLACTPLLLANCANVPGQSAEESMSQAACIAGYTLAGGAAGFVSGVLVDSKSAQRGKQTAVVLAVAGGVAGFAIGWMKCINQFAKAEHVSIPAVGGGPSDQATGRPMIRIEDSFLDPAAVSGGGKPVLRVRYAFNSPDKDAKVVQQVFYQFTLPDGKVIAADAPAREELTLEPGTKRIDLPVEVPSQIDAGVLQIRVQLTVADQTATVSQDLNITADKAQLGAAQSEAARRRIAFASGTARASGAAAAAASVVARGPTGDRSVPSEKAAGGQATVLAARLNVRDQPSTRGTVMTVLVKDYRIETVATAQGAEGRWHKVKLPDGRLGWVTASGVKMAE
jgi:hypothetical protein